MNKRWMIRVLLLLQCCALTFRPAYGELPDPRVQEARQYMKSGEWDYASHAWRSVLTQDPSRMEAHLGLAQSMIQAGLPKEAIHYLEKIQQPLKPVPEIHWWLAEAHRQAGNPQMAVKYYLSLLALSPFHPGALQEIKQLLPRIEGDEQRFARQILGQHTELVRKEAAVAFAKQDYQNAARLYELVSRQSRVFKDINDYGLSLLLSGRNREASGQFRLISGKTRDWHILSNAALAELGIGNSYRARKLIDQAMGFCKDNAGKASLYNQLGYIYEQGKKNTQARFAYEKAIELDGQLKKAHLNQAFLHVQERNYDQAIRIYRQLLAQAPKDAEVLNRLGFAYEMKAQHAKAARAYQDAIAAQADYKDAYYNLGTMYKKMGKLEKANRAFKAMMGVEFQEMEAGTLAASPDRKAAGLLKYVEVFTAHPAPATNTVSLPHPAKGTGAAISKK